VIAHGDGRPALITADRVGEERFGLLRVAEEVRIYGSDAAPAVIFDFYLRRLVDLVLRPGSALEALEQMRDEGIGAIGLGVRGAQHHLTAVESGRFDAILIHDDYSHIRRTDDVVIQRAAQADVGVLLGRALMMGLLAGGDPTADPRLADHPDAPAAREWWEWARERGLPLRALAIQFGLRNRDVASVVVGASSRTGIEESISVARLVHRVKSLAYRDDRIYT
jgi:aryl-alcohol dehydrogenase-like predicted oxidoreductase